MGRAEGPKVVWGSDPRQKPFASLWQDVVAAWWASVAGALDHLSVLISRDSHLGHHPRPPCGIACGPALTSVPACNVGILRCPLVQERPAKPPPDTKQASKKPNGSGASCGLGEHSHGKLSNLLWQIPCPLKAEDNEREHQRGPCIHVPKEPGMPFSFYDFTVETTRNSSTSTY